MLTPFQTRNMIVSEVTRNIATIDELEKTIAKMRSRQNLLTDAYLPMCEDSMFKIKVLLSPDGNQLWIHGPKERSEKDRKQFFYILNFEDPENIPVIIMDLLAEAQAEQDISRQIAEGMANQNMLSEINAQRVIDAIAAENIFCSWRERISPSMSFSPNLDKAYLLITRLESDIHHWIGR